MQLPQKQLNESAEQIKKNPVAYFGAIFFILFSIIFFRYDYRREKELNECKERSIVMQNDRDSIYHMMIFNQNQIIREVDSTLNKIVFKSQSKNVRISK